MNQTRKEDSWTQPSVKPIPDGMHTVTPHLICAGAAEAIEFYQKAFGATELSRVPGANGKLMHASVRIGDSVVMLFPGGFGQARGSIGIVGLGSVPQFRVGPLGDLAKTDRSNGCRGAIPWPAGLEFLTDLGVR